MSESIYEMAKENVSSKSVVGSKTSITSRKSSVGSCRICLSHILDAASLTCGHKFCEKCLENYWDAKDRPGFIVCPLCRTYAFNVDFTKQRTPSTDDFRKTFNTLEDIDETEEQRRQSSLTCFKLSILLMPAVYYLLKWLAPSIIELLGTTHESSTTD